MEEIWFSISIAIKNYLQYVSAFDGFENDPCMEFATKNIATMATKANKKIYCVHVGVGFS